MKDLNACLASLNLGLPDEVQNGKMEAKNAKECTN